MGTGLITRVTRWHRAAAIGAGLALAGGLAAGVTTLATAAPAPTISQVQALVNADQAKFDQAVQQYDAATAQLGPAQARLKQVNEEVQVRKARFEAARKAVVQIATANYEDSGQTSLAGLLTTNDPSTVLSMASIVTELAGARNQQTQTFLTAAQQLASVQQQQQHYTSGIQLLVSRRAASKNAAKSALDHENATLSSLTAAQQAAVQRATIAASQAKASTTPSSSTSTSGSTTGSGSGSSGSTNNVPTSGAAGKAVAFVYAQLGCPYVWGGTGPCSAGFDCSGLVQAAWAAAGVSIPRDTYSQWAALPHVSMSDLQPGDLIMFNGIGHVAMYVGGGYIIDAPRTGLNVQKIPLSTSWYSSSEDGAVRP